MLHNGRTTAYVITRRSQWIVAGCLNFDAVHSHTKTLLASDSPLPLLMINILTFIGQWHKFSNFTDASAFSVTNQ